MSAVSAFFTEAQKQDLISAIKRNELKSSVEIRIHIENHCKSNDPKDRAVEVFYNLKMDQTELRNGVLIYLAVKDHKVAIIGDKGINAVVPKDCWNECYSIMTERFREGDFCGGIVEAMDRFGDNIKSHFPYQSDDVNELSDDISFGKD